MPRNIIYKALHTLNTDENSYYNFERLRKRFNISGMQEFLDFINPIPIELIFKDGMSIKNEEPSELLEMAKQFFLYSQKELEKFEIGKNVPSKDDDFGLKCDLSNYYIKTDESFINTLKKCNTDAVITAHLHKNNYCISYDGIKWIYAVKTGFYDSHIHEKTGGTFITVQNEKFDVNHVFYPYY